jgi:hypothetical protein
VPVRKAGLFSSCVSVRAIHGGSGKRK